MNDESMSIYNSWLKLWFIYTITNDHVYFQRTSKKKFGDFSTKYCAIKRDDTWHRKDVSKSSVPREWWTLIEWSCIIPNFYDSQVKIKLYRYLVGSIIPIRNHSCQPSYSYPSAIHYAYPQSCWLSLSRKHYIQHI